MVTNLNIQNFTIISDLDIDFRSGMTVLTGETGAGKSIIIDTLNLALGGRADSKTVGGHGERCDITASFAITNNTAAKTWLAEHELSVNDECILRRTITKDGRSRCFINGIPCPAQQTRDLGALLVNIHGQHEHQNLLKREQQRNLLDDFAKHNGLCEQVRNLFNERQQCYHEYQQSDELANNDLELLNYQIQEIDDLNMQENEIEQLHSEYKQLNNAEQLIGNINQVIAIINQNELLNAQNLITPFRDLHPQLTASNELLNNAIIQLEEAHHELRDYLDNIDLQPERLKWLEERLNRISDIARKHKIKDSEIPNLHQELTNKLTRINNAAAYRQQLATKIAELTEQYNTAAKKLTKSRQAAAKKLSQEIVSQIKRLNLPQAEFAVNFSPIAKEQGSSSGLEQVEFQVTTNPGQPLQPLSKVASGGELSRLSLAIQTITAQQNTTPTLIFDEVDVGIGGKTAEIVGQMLQQLGSTAQILCVTHLPQVAALGDHHLQVNKVSTSNQTTTNITPLTGDDRIQEIARMLGGIKITAQTLAHAKEMLTTNNS